MSRYGVLAYFLEGGEEVYELIGPFDAYFASLMCSEMAHGLSVGGRWVHVTRAKVVPWL